MTHIIILQTLMWAFSGITTLWMVVCWVRFFGYDGTKQEYYLYSLFVSIVVFGLAIFMQNI